MKRIESIFRDAAGATTIEYAAIASLVSIVAVAGYAAIGSAVTALFASVPSF
jgi:Flp pilus assembly pilin Flp